MLFRDHFSRTEQGDSRRIGDDHLLDDASGSFFQRQDLPVLIKICLPRRPCLFRKRENLKLLSADRTETPFFLSCLPFLRIFLPPRFRMLHGLFFLLFCGILCQHLHCPDQPFDILRFVGKGDDRHHVFLIGQFRADPETFIKQFPQPVAGNPQINGRKDQTGRIFVKHRRRAGSGSVQHTHARYFFQFLLCIQRQTAGFLHHLPSVYSKFSSGCIERRHQKVGRGRALYQVEIFCHPLPVNPVGTQVEQGTLCKGSCRLMKTLCHGICSACKRTFWQLLREIQMRTMGFIHKEHRAVAVADFRDSFQITGNPVIRRADQQDGTALRFPSKRFLNGFRGNTPPKIPFLQIFRHHIDRRCSAHDQAHQHRFVNIPRNNNLVPFLHGGQHHRLIAAGGSVDQKEGMSCVKQFCRQILCLPDWPLRLMEVVQPFRL